MKQMFIYHYTDQRRVQMLEVGEVDDIFVPNPEDLLVNLEQSHTLVEELLTMLPEAHCTSYHTQSALGAALQAAYKLMVGIFHLFLGILLVGSLKLNIKYFYIKSITRISRDSCYH